MKHNYDDENLIQYVQSSMSYAQVLRKMNITPAGGNYSTLKRKIKEQEIDVSHFTGQGWNVGLRFKPNQPLPIEDFLQVDRPCSSHNLKKRLIKEGMKDHICESCQLISWLDKPVPLELDHINGDHNDNRIENLRLLCPNCHAQTDNYRGRAIKSTKYEHLRRYKDPTYCLDCYKVINDKAQRCKSCAGKEREPTKISWPPTEELKLMLLESSYCAVAKTLGVSDNAVRKRVKNHK